MPKRISESAALLSVADNAQQTRRRIKLIEGDRWGSSGYYSGAVLQEAAKAGIFSKGLPMFADHPSESEANDRPERSIKDLWAALDSDAVYEANNPEGPGLYADAIIWPHVAPVIEAMKDNIGVSIRAFAEMGYGEAAGRSGPIVEKFTGAASVDFVTAAGCGGKIMQLLESARQIDEHREPIRLPGEIREATVEAVRRQLQDHLPPQSWVRDFDPDAKIVYFDHYENDNTDTYQQTYQTAEDGTVSLSGLPQQVNVTTTYVPVSAGQETPNESHQEDEMPQIEEARLRQLEEAASRVSALEAERDTAVKERDEARAEKRASDLAEAAAKRAREAVKDLPTAMADRVVREAVRDLPIKDDELDTKAFDAAVESAIENEKAYAKSFAPQGLTGFGDTSPATESAAPKPTVSLWGRKIKEA